MTAPGPGGGQDQQDKGLAGRLAAQCKAAADATAAMWPDTAERLSRLQAALEAEASAIWPSWPMAARRDRDGE